MVAEPLTIMAVHAHPDDEVIGTGGVLARYAAEGVTTVLVTCTDGAMGDGPGGVKPGEDGHDPEAVVTVRDRELAESCRLLGITHVEKLGYRDSGMEGWATNAAPGAFRNVDHAEAVDRVAALMERYRPQVVVTYDENGNYGHPDHIQAHRVAVAAARRCGVAKVYYTAIPRAGIAMLRDGLRERGIDPDEVGLPNPDDHAFAEFGTPDELIGAVVDVEEWTTAKRGALAAHSSQTDNSFFFGLPPEAFQVAFAREFFVRAWPEAEAGRPEDDLFSGLR